MRSKRSLNQLMLLGGAVGTLLVSSLQAYDTIVVFNEIHYHPAGADDPGLEFVELYNQNSVDVDLSGWRLSGGIDFVFPERTVMRGGGYLVVASNPAALEAAAGISGALGPFIGMLDNGGERLRIRNHNDRIMDEVEYNDRPVWSVGPDGSGASLSKISPRTGGAVAREWTHSRAMGGTPGRENFTDPPASLVINEVAGSVGLPGAFFVEIHNTGGSVIDLEGFVVETEEGEAHVIAAGVSAPAFGEVSIPESVLGFRAEDGDNLYLYRPERSGLIDAVRVDDEGRARIPNGTGAFHVTGAEIPESDGVPNPEGPPCPVVINEIMYHHRPTYAESGAEPVAYAESDEEWVELYNTSEDEVSVGGWELAGAVRFTFPAQTTIAAGGYLVVARDAAAFSAKFAEVPVVGDFSGSLSNQGEELLLLDGVGNPADRVSYGDGKPWPEEADGGGSSLELINPHIDNSGPGAWQASDNAATSEWHDYEFTLRASPPVYSPGLFSFHELRLGMLDAGTVLLDKMSVVEDPTGAARELLVNGEFNGRTGWRMLGTHNDSRPSSDAGERVMRVVANARMNYMNNLIESNLTFSGALRPVQNGGTYRVSFRAKWLSGSPQFRFELYYNKLARTVILRQPDRHGTPGAQNSTYAATTGPMIRNLRHAPAVPAPGEPVVVSAVASDPDGIGSMTLRYRINSGAFLELPMSVDPLDDRWKATIPGQANGTLIQIYLHGLDRNGEYTFEPAGGARARALIKVDPSVAHGAKNSIRVLMVASEATALHAANDILSNDRFGCTIITDEEDIAYDAGIRLRGSMFSRRSEGTTSLNIKFPSDRLYRGVHGTITTRRTNIREIVVKHIINQAGGLHDNYNDIFYQYGHRPAQTGKVRVEMARFGSNYLRGLPGGDGTDGTVFKMEGIREFQATQSGPDSPKLPFPIGWVRNFDIANQGRDKEAYRHNMRINSNLEVDDYTSIMRMCQTFSLSGAALERAVPGAIDVDRWTRQFALMSLCGIGDTYSQGNPHNLNFYVRPSDGLVEPMPWDWDFVFNRNTSSPLWGDRNVAKIFARPVYSRLFYGHLRDLIRTTFNTRDLTRWFQHYGTCAGENYTGYLNDVTARANYVLSRLPASVAFRVTTNNGDAFSTATPLVQLRGDGWIDVREVYLNQGSEPVVLKWTDGDSWEFTAPLAPGLNELVLTAFNHQGEEVGSDTIAITNTGVVEAASAANLAVSELMYQPAGEALEEFVEVMNISGDATVDLSGVRFTEGIEFTFPANTLLSPGERLLVVQDAPAFAARHGAGLPVVGEFANETRLSNGGEQLRLEGLGGTVIRDFTYDNNAPWPAGADGGGHSLVLIAPHSDPDHGDPLSWRASVEVGGSPAGSDASEFAGDPDGDDNRDGLTNFMNHALGSNGSGPMVQVGAGGEATVTYTRNLAADDVRVMLEVSENLEDWRAADAEFGVLSESAPVGGLSTVVLRRITPPDPATSVQFVRLRVENR